MEAATLGIRSDHSWFESSDDSIKWAAIVQTNRIKCWFLLLRRLSWFDGSGMGFSLEYPTIGLHAISRDVSAYPQEHLYVMVNGKLSGQAQTMHEMYLRSQITIIIS